MCIGADKDQKFMEMASEYLSYDASCYNLSLGEGLILYNCISIFCMSISAAMLKGLNYVGQKGS